MIGEEIRDELKEVTVEELRKVTWDYSEDGLVGLYHGKIIRQYLWETKECGGVNPLLITRGNVEEGWVEYFEVENPRAVESMTILFSGLKRDKDDNPIKTRFDCKVVVDLLDVEGNHIVTLS